VLQRHGGDFSLRDQDDRTVADLARKEGKVELAELIDSFKSTQSRLKHVWDHRMKPENAEVISFLGAMLAAHAVYYYNVLGFTSHNLLLLMQAAAIAMTCWCVAKMSRHKEAGSVVRNDFANLTGSHASAHNDHVFSGLRFDPTAKVAVPLRAYYSEESGNVCRRYHCHCTLVGADVCGDNFRSFIVLLSGLVVDVAIAVFVAGELIALTPDAPSPLLPHLFIWHGLWMPSYTILTMLTCYGFFLFNIAAGRLLKAVQPITKGLTMHEELYWTHYTYLQDPAGRMANPFDQGWQKNIMGFLRGSKFPEADIYSISELNPAPWRHPKDKRQR